jgi:DNA-binding MarR family transcriptional regulator/phage shock protein PspC (stress-responsive transcriptional regulator)
VTAAEAVRRFPFEGLALPEANGRAALAREAVADHLHASDACQLEAFDQALALVAERASLAFHAQEGWVDGVRAGLAALLEFFDEEPKLARYLVVHSAQAGSAVLERRREVLDRIAVLLDDERAPARGYPPPLAAQAVASGVLGVLYERLSESRPGPLVELAGPLMSFTVLPFLGVRAARRELAGAHAQNEAADLDVLKDSAARVNSRASLVLSVIGAEPGLNSRELAARAGISDEGHSSRLTARLERLGLIENTRNPSRRFAPKAWRLTAAGEKLEAAIEREAAASEPASAFDLPAEFIGRVDDRAILMLRAVGDQPWLRNAEVAERAGVADETQAAMLLETLAELGLAVSEREAHQRGTPKVWRLTPAGERLDRAIGRETPALPRSVALELMWESGGRLSDSAIGVLRVVGAEPGLSNNDVALRVGIADKNSTSQLLARLSKRGLIENARNGGRQNVWQLTAAGESLERAIWHETPALVQRELALEMLRDRGGRLNHRVVSVLRVVGAEPELSNNEIAHRVAIEGKGHASTLLSRLARFGLIENLVVDPAPFEANAWRLTTSGTELEQVIRHETGRRT